MDHAERLADLDRRLAVLPGAVVAFSGGVDSTMLLHCCVRVLGADRVLAVTADSPSLPRSELAEAAALATTFGVTHEVLATDELGRDGYRRNGPDRCYFCKAELFDVMAAHFAERAAGQWPVLYGAIADDVADHRPGGRAAAEHGVQAPLAAAGWTKDDVRRYSRAHGLPTADKPASACLASRVAYGTPVDAALLGRLERAEAAVRALGYRQLRVRHHGDVARVELEADALVRAVTEDRDAIVAALRAEGWTFVTLDLLGYRSGAMNEVLR